MMYSIYFNGNHICNILDNNGQLCAFGEKRACIVTIDTDTLSHTDRKTLLQDLIWDSQFLKVCII